MAASVVPVLGQAKEQRGNPVARRGTGPTPGPFVRAINLRPQGPAGSRDRAGKSSAAKVPDNESLHGASLQRETLCRVQDTAGPTTARPARHRSAARNSLQGGDRGGLDE